MCQEVAAKAKGPELQELATEAVRTRAGVLLAAGKHDEAYKAFLEVAQKAPEGDYQTKAKAYNAIGDALMGKGRTREALLAYLRVRVLYFKSRDELPHALYGAARCFTVLRRANEARELVALLTKDYPKSAWTAKAKKELGG